MLNARKESKLALGAILFIGAYSVYLFIFRTCLLRFDDPPGSILKPEPEQIAVLGLFLLLYYFAYIGLSSFSCHGAPQKVSAIAVAVVINAAVMYGLVLWYDAIMRNRFLFGNVGVQRPWYAQEQGKTLIVNLPIAVFCLAVFFIRLKEMLHPENTNQS